MHRLPWPEQETFAKATMTCGEEHATNRPSWQSQLQSISDRARLWLKVSNKLRHHVLQIDISCSSKGTREGNLFLAVAAPLVRHVTGRPLHQLPLQDRPLQAEQFSNLCLDSQIKTEHRLEMKNLLQTSCVSFHEIFVSDKLFDGVKYKSHCFWHSVVHQIWLKKLNLHYSALSTGNSAFSNWHTQQRK